MSLEALYSIQQRKLTHEKRETIVKDMDEFMSAEIVGTTARQMYDCQDRWKQRVNLVRSEGDPATSDAVNNANEVRDYFKNELNRNSVEDTDMYLILNVHYGTKLY